MKDGNPLTVFLKNLPIKDGKAHTIVREVIDCISMLGLDTGRIVSLDIDSTMMVSSLRLTTGLRS